MIDARHKLKGVENIEIHCRGTKLFTTRIYSQDYSFLFTHLCTHKIVFFCACVVRFSRPIRVKKGVQNEKKKDAKM